jgi:hypothetical protein
MSKNGAPVTEPPGGWWWENMGMTTSRTSKIERAYLDLNDLVAYTGWGKSTLRRYMKTMSLPHFKLNGKVVVRKTEFDGWIEAFRAIDDDLDSIVDSTIRAVN